MILTIISIIITDKYSNKTRTKKRTEKKLYQKQPNKCQQRNLKKIKSFKYRDESSKTTHAS